MNCELTKEFRLRNANVAISYNVPQLNAERDFNHKTQ